MTREEIRKQWIYDCNVACDNAMARLKDLEEKKSIPLSQDELIDCISSVMNKHPDISYNVFRDMSDKIIDTINRKLNQ